MRDRKNMPLLQEFAQIKVGLMFDRKKATDTDAKQKYRVVSFKSFNKNAKFNDEFCEEFEASEKLKNDYFVKKDDILIRLRDPVLAVYITKDYEDLIFSSLVARVKIHSENFNPKFVTYFLNSDKVKKMLFSAIPKQTIAAIKIADIAKLEIPCPSLQKQNLIVQCLDALYKEEELLQKMISQKQKFAKHIFNSL